MQLHSDYTTTIISEKKNPTRRQMRLNSPDHANVSS